MVNNLDLAFENGGKLRHRPHDVMHRSILEETKHGDNLETDVEFDQHQHCIALGVFHCITDISVWAHIKNKTYVNRDVDFADFSAFADFFG